MPHPYLAGGPRPRILAHRGLVTDELAERGIVENSLAAMEAASEAGADYLESDCRLTSDGAVVLFHDATLLRVLGDERPVAGVSRRELTDLMRDRGGLLTLEEALEAFPAARFNIDVKSEEAAEPAGRILAPHSERVLLTSFSDAHRHRALRALAATGAPRPATSPGSGALARILVAVKLGLRPWASRALAAVDALQIPERRGKTQVLTPRLIAAAHRAGVEVHVWTVNGPKRMERLSTLGVDGIVTDRTDLALSTLDPHRRSDGRPS